MRAGSIILAIAALIAMAPLLAPQDPTDLGGLDLMNALLPPWWIDGASPQFPLGTDAQGRCILSSILFGLRLSVLVSTTVVALSLTAGSLLGLWVGHIGGPLDRLAMRAADAALSLHPVLIALVLAALLRNAIPIEWSERAGTLVVVVALGAVGWAPYARTARVLTRAECQLPYIQAARLMRRPARHILASACSGDLLCERLEERASIVLAQALLQLSAAELAFRLDHGAFAVDPFGLDRVQPRTFARQAADQ